MLTQPKWREPSDLQRQSLQQVSPFLFAYLVVSFMVLASYDLGLTGLAVGNGSCSAIELLNPGITDIHRTFGGQASLDRICQLFVPTVLMHIMFSGILSGVVIASRGVEALKNRYLYFLIAFAFVPLFAVTHDRSNSIPSRLEVVLRDGSFGAYVIFFIGNQLIAGMLAALCLQKIRRP